MQRFAIAVQESRVLTKNGSPWMAVAFCILWPGITWAQAAIAPPEEFGEPAFRSGVNLVLIDTSVVRGTVPVSGLQRDSFTIRENGTPRELAVFEPGTANVSIALVLDNSGSMGPRWSNVMRSVQYLLSLLNPHDEIGLSIFNDRPIELAERREAGTAPLPWLSLLGTYTPTGRTALYDAMLKARTDLMASKYDRQVMILVSDGSDTHSSAHLKDVIQRLQSSNILVYCVGLFQRGEEGTDAEALRALAETTGGIALLDSQADNLSRDFGKIMADLRSRYLLGYRSPDAAAGRTEVRKIAVTAKDAEGKKLEVRARPEYRVSNGVEAHAK